MGINSLENFFLPKIMKDIDNFVKLLRYLTKKHYHSWCCVWIAKHNFEVGQNEFRGIWPKIINELEDKCMLPLDPISFDLMTPVFFEAIFECIPQQHHQIIIRKS